MNSLQEFDFYDNEKMIDIFNDIINELNQLETTVQQQDAQIKLLKDKLEREEKYG